ncbi:2-iminoacetate synthase ThiH [Candidatus Methanoprimaticola sp. MG2]|uniref:2-iminoacetate synthase ThiH n=1 Tax=Candidatus Methanoprimaticola sp. MG2 TaxID=3228838 RepID=UPI0039C61C19
MEVIDSDIRDAVLGAGERFDPSSYTESDVRRAIRSEPSVEGFAAMLSPAAEPLLEEMAARAKTLTRDHFGNSVCMFTPLYVSNYCVNGCVYCGFNCRNSIDRLRLDLDSVARELDAIKATGLEEVLLLTGESPSKSDVQYVCDCVRLAAERFAVVGIEVFPMNTEDYERVQQAGADYVTVFQETYDPERYDELHPTGPKSVFSYRFDSQERALRGGMRGVAFGALLGLGDFRRDAFCCGLHASLVQRRFPAAEISMSLPRLRPAAHLDQTAGVTEAQLLQVSLAYRIFLPFAGQTISTRERPGFRDGIVGLSATKISAGVSVGIGEHSNSGHGEGQFVISDPRGVDDVVDALRSNGLQPVMADYVRTGCRL